MVIEKCGLNSHQMLISLQQAKDPSTMVLVNHSHVTEFFIQGFSDNPNLQVPLFFVLLLVYLITVAGNSMVLSVICLDPHLHKPMYLFLLHMSFIDICFTSVTLPKAMAVHLAKQNAISIAACTSQLYFFLLFVSTEFLLLTAMAFDRYVAICNPLRYSTIMSRRMCAQLAATSWIISILDAMPHTLLISGLSFCGRQHLNHFFCDITALSKLACSDTSSMAIITFTIGVLLGISSSMMTVTSYALIIATILRIRSAAGRHLAFSTCSAHLTAVLLFYGTAFCNYLRPGAIFNSGEEKLFSLFFAALIPMLNPLIYTLRNKEVKKALQKACQGKAAI
ncbi:olfactory receptor 5G9-like [Ambystoma mexicanum]|uniref:olfactory receptor 5G9-like n=1 Tax=Ambystoma mexicanum TaxID=8296 RepID=UPI0037E7CFF5